MIADKEKLWNMLRQYVAESDLEEIMFEIPENKDPQYEQGYAEGLSDGARMERERLSCDDAISRQAVIEFIGKQIDHSLWAFEKLVNGIKALPSVTPQQNVENPCIDCGMNYCVDEVCKKKNEFLQQKVGRWIRVHYISDGKDTAMNKCSNCQEEFGWDIETGISFEDYKYCPNCGARMVEPQPYKGESEV